MIGDGNPIDLHKLPLADLMSWLEMNPPAVPWSSLTNVPFSGVPFSVLNEEIAASPISGFGMSLGLKAATARYAHLLLVTACQTNAAADEFLRLQFNTDTSPFSTNYGWDLWAAGGGSSNAADASFAVGIASKSFQSPILTLIPNFLATGKKQCISIYTSLGNANFAGITAGSWALTDPITQVQFSLASGPMSTGSRFTAYALGAQS